MRVSTILLLGGFASFAIANQGPIHLTRHFAVGDKETYKFHMTGSMQYGDLDYTATEVRTIKKVYPDGDADLETAIKDTHALVGGNDYPVPEQPATTEKVDKYGVPVEQSGDQGTQFMFSPITAALFDKDLKVGDSIPIDVTSVDKKIKTKGSVVLRSVGNGEADFTGDLETTAPGVDGPQKVNLDVAFDTTTARANKIKATISQLPLQQGGIVLNNAIITITRVTS